MKRPVSYTHLDVYKRQQIICILVSLKQVILYAVYCRAVNVTCASIINILSALYGICSSEYLSLIHI